MTEDNSFEATVRTLRDEYYGNSISDTEWALCREHWMKPLNVALLRQKVKELREEWIEE
jgi:hypothetical protein